MSKELEIIKELRCLVYSCQDSGFITNAEKHFLPLLDRLETELKDYEELKKLKLLPYPKVNDEEYRRNVVKSLQALEIIKEKRVNLEYIKCCENYEQYKTICSYWNEITEEEYDLLKEVLL